MNGEQPAWDNADPEGSLRRQAAFLNEKARFTFLTDKFHTELFFLYKEDGQGAMLQPPPKVDRDTFVASLKTSLRDYGVYGVNHPVEA